MFSIRKSNDVCEVKIETKLGGSDFKKYMEFMKTIPSSQYHESTYMWTFPCEHIEMYHRRYGEQTAWFNSFEQIKGIEEVILPSFPLIEDFSDLKLAPYDFQKQGISFLYHTGSAIISDEMGLGNNKFAVPA
ncbi:MAG: hypothetical protein ACRC5C_01815 [Bacilli bacterium]